MAIYYSYLVIKDPQRDKYITFFDEQDEFNLLKTWFSSEEGDYLDGWYPSIEEAEKAAAAEIESLKDK